MQQNSILINNNNNNNNNNNTTTLHQLLSIPSNRVCADCHSILVDTSQVFVSFPKKHSHYHNSDDDDSENSLLVDDDDDNNNKTTTTTVPDPADEAINRVVFAGVLICSLCADVHDLLLYQHVPRPPPTCLPYIHNQQVAHILEAYYSPLLWPRPSSEHHCTKTERWLFVRAKYDALAFCLPSTQQHPTTTIAINAWQNIVQRHDWDQQYPQLCHLESLSLKSSSSQPVTNPLLTDLQKNRLVRYFCVLTPSETLDPVLMTQQQPQQPRPHPEQIYLAPQVSDCFPEPEDDFPTHLGLLVFPQGCHARTQRVSPSFFTFCVTTAHGERLYGAVLQVYDDVQDVQCLYDLWESNSASQQHPSSHKSHHPKQQHPKQQQQQQQQQQELFFPKALVLLSYQPYWDLFRKFLCLIYRIALTPAPLPLERYIAHFVAQVPIPPPNVQIQLCYTTGTPWTITQTNHHRWPLRDFSFQPLFSCLRISHILIVWGCLLREQKVVLCTQQSSLLTPVAEALLSLLYPFQWQGVYLPVMPKHMVELLEAPVPFLLGLQGPLPLDRPKEDDDIVWVGLDSDQVILGGGCGGLPALPERDALKLKDRLLDCAAGLYMPLNNPIHDDNNGGRMSFTSSYWSNGKTTGGPKYAQCQPAEVFSNRTQRREDILGSINRAYRDAELHQPVRLMEQGAISLSTTSPRAKSLPSGPSTRFSQKRKMRLKKGSLSTSAHRNLDNRDLFSMEDPDGFCSSDIRSAFFKFFVSVFRDYRQFLLPGDKDFQYNAFVTNLMVNAKQQAYLKSVLNTQLFSHFLQECHQVPPSPRVQFLDDAIRAKSLYMKRVLQRQMSNHSSSYLPSESEQIYHETYTPPPPSHAGLPEEQTIWHYASFPSLDLSLIGPLRPLRQFDYLTNTQNAPTLVNGTTGIHPWQNYSQRLFQQATQKHPISVMARLEQALGTMMAPFGSSPTTQSLRGLQRSQGSNNLSFQRKTDSQDKIWNIRRKQSILIGIFMVLQRHVRVFIHQKKQHLSKLSAEPLELVVPMALTHEAGALKLQHFFRGILLKKQFRTTRWLVTHVASIVRGRQVRIAFDLFKKAVARVQAIVRARKVRKLLFSILTKRIQLYRKCVFELWKHDCTSLTHRTSVWRSSSKCGLLLQHGFLEEEIKRLWNNLHGKTDIFAQTVDRSVDIVNVEKLSNSLGLKNELYRLAYRVTVTSASNNATKLDRNSREATERLQVYERLSLKDDVAVVKKFCSDLGCPSKTRLKKTWLAQNVWQSFPMADYSTNFMTTLFTELNDSTDIYLLPPSRKGLKRIPVDQLITIPRYIPSINQRIQQAVAEVARVALLHHPVIPGSSRRNFDLDHFLHDVIMKQHHFSNTSEARVFLMNRNLGLYSTQ